MHPPKIARYSPPLTHCPVADALRAVEQQLAHLYAEEVREKGRNSFLARTLEDVRDTLAAIEKSGAYCSQVASHLL